MTLFISFYFKFLKTSPFKTKSKYYIKLHYVYLNNFTTFLYVIVLVTGNRFFKTLIF